VHFFWGTLAASISSWKSYGEDIGRSISPSQDPTGTLEFPGTAG
jgi:hypothetical protein